MSWMVMDGTSSCDAFYQGSPKLIKPEKPEDDYGDWAFVASTATWFATKGQAERVARSYDRWQVENDLRSKEDEVCLCPMTNRVSQDQTQSN